MKPKIYITRKIPDCILNKLEEFFEVSIWNYENKPVPRTVLEEEITRVDGLFCMLTETIDEKLLKKAKKLKVISTMAVGYDNIDVKKATELDIMVTNTPGVLTETTADLTFSLMMASARRITEASDYLKRGEWETWSPMLLTGQDIYNATIGIVGMGRIGEAVARRAKGFNMNIIYYNRNRKYEVEKDLGCEYVEFDELLKNADYIVIMIPYTPKTVNLITSKEFKLMKKSAIFINTSRGGIVNEGDLYNALKTGEIWAAGLDVFDQEPISMDHPLLTLENVTALPHIGSASINTRIKMGELAAKNIIEALTGNTPSNLVH